MPQVQLPIFPEGVTHITAEVAFQRDEGKVYYFNGHLPVFVHEKRDLATFRMFIYEPACDQRQRDSSADLARFRSAACDGQALR